MTPPPPGQRPESRIPGSHAEWHIPGPDEPSIPELEIDETIPPRPEEEIADLARAEPDLEDHSHPRE